MSVSIVILLICSGIFVGVVNTFAGATKIPEQISSICRGGRGGVDLGLYGAGASDRDR